MDEPSFPTVVLHGNCFKQVDQNDHGVTDGGCVYFEVGVFSDCLSRCPINDDVTVRLKTYEVTTTHGETVLLLSLAAEVREVVNVTTRKTDGVRGGLACQHRITEGSSGGKKDS